VSEHGISRGDRSRKQTEKDQTRGAREPFRHPTSRAGKDEDRHLSSSEAGGWPMVHGMPITGQAKQSGGEVTSSTDLASEGRSQKLAGKARKTVGQIERIFDK
jgi:hypothetical protein